MIGKRTIWEKIPTKKIFGFCKTLLKSFKVRPNPKPSIINASAKGAILVTMSIQYLKGLRYFRQVYDVNYL